MTEERDVTTQEPPADAPEVDPRSPQEGAYHGDRVQDDAEQELGPYQRLSDDLAAGRITTAEAVKRLLAGAAADENGDDVLTAVYADEYDDDGQPHEAR